MKLTLCGSQASILLAGRLRPLAVSVLRPGPSPSLTSSHDPEAAAHPRAGRGSGPATRCHFLQALLTSSGHKVELNGTPASVEKARSVSHRRASHPWFATRITRSFGNSPVQALLQAS